MNECPKCGAEVLADFHDPMNRLGYVMWKCGSIQFSEDTEPRQSSSCISEERRRNLSDYKEQQLEEYKNIISAQDREIEGLREAVRTKEDQLESERLKNAVLREKLKSASRFWVRRPTLEKPECGIYVEEQRWSDGWHWVIASEARGGQKWNTITGHWSHIATPYPTAEAAIAAAEEIVE